MPKYVLTVAHEVHAEDLEEAYILVNNRILDVHADIVGVAEGPSAAYMSEEYVREAFKRAKERLEKHPELLDDGNTYKIVRHYQGGRRVIVYRGLTLGEARAHCRDPETSSWTATSKAAKARTRRNGEWFDGYTKE